MLLLTDINFDLIPINPKCFSFLQLNQQGSTVKAFPHDGNWKSCLDCYYIGLKSWRSIVPPDNCLVTDVSSHELRSVGLWALRQSY